LAPWRAGAGRGDVGGDWHLRVQDCLDDIPHRRHEAAGRIDVEDYECCADTFGMLDAADDIVGGSDADAPSDL
jgi:hypothetical protein